MKYRGVSNWPPTWAALHQSAEHRSLRGEIGILKYALWHEKLPGKCFLIIEHEMAGYMGCLIFDDTAFCRQIHALLQRHINRSISDIGALNLTDTL
jgi:hypothetical protein